MANDYFRFKEFTVWQDRCAMKVTTDGCLFGAWCADKVSRLKPASVLDIGTGTGLLSLMVAQQSSALIDAVEIEAPAFGQAVENVAASPWATHINLFHQSIQSFNPLQRYGCIISNPPFYENDLKSPNKARAIAHHSLNLSLPDLLQQAERLLTNGGTLFLLLPTKRREEIFSTVAATGWVLHERTEVRPLLMHLPFRMMLTLQRGSGPVPAPLEMIIREADGTYHPDFVHYLKPYYLHL